MTTESEIVTLIKDLVAIPSINPGFKQEGLPETYYGEAKKVEYIKKYLTKIGVPPAYMREVTVNDERVPTGSRPTVFVTIPGDVHHKRELIVLGHTDVVPPSDLNKWTTPPFSPAVRDGRIYGRGTVDNSYAVAAMLIAAKRLLYEGITPKTDVILVFAADEEAGSRYGMDYIMDCNPPFSDTAQAYVPDAGDNGKSVEIAEKGMVEFKFMYTGKNARFSAVTFEKSLYDFLHTTFLKKCEGFTPETSTFEPTADETTTNSAPNVIPGEYTSGITVMSIPESIDLKEWVKDRAASFMNRENEGLPPDSGRTVMITVALDHDELVLTYKGKECHASRPDMGRNARLASLYFESVLLDEFNQKGIVLATKNTYWSTWDCRIVPDHKGAAQKVRDAVKDVAQTESDVIDFKELAFGEPQATPEDAPISRAVHHAYTQLGTDPEYSKIGGRTFAATREKVVYKLLPVVLLMVTFVINLMSMW